MEIQKYTHKSYVLIRSSMSKDFPNQRDRYKTRSVPNLYFRYIV